MDVDGEGVGSERVDRPQECAREEVRSTPRYPPIVPETGFVKPRRVAYPEVTLTDSEVNNLLDLIEEERQRRERGANPLVLTIHSTILGDNACMMGAQHPGSCWYRRPNNRWDNDFRKRLP